MQKTESWNQGFHLGLYSLLSPRVLPFVPSVAGMVL
jgi:hypothetical protein